MNSPTRLPTSAPVRSADLEAVLDMLADALWADVVATAERFGVFPNRNEASLGEAEVKVFPLGKPLERE